MKKILTITFTALSLLLILDSLNFSHAVMMFLLAGVIPGTNLAIDGAQMLEFFALAAGFTVARVTAYFIRTFKPNLASTSRARA